MTKDIRDYINVDQFEKDENSKYYSKHTNDVLQNAFNGELLDFQSTGGYQGKSVAAWKLEDDFYAIISSYFGSCTVCDKFLGATTTEESRKALRSLSHSARKFESLESMREWINSDAPKEAEHYSHEYAIHLEV